MSITTNITDQNTQNPHLTRPDSGTRDGVARRYYEQLVYLCNQSVFSFNIRELTDGPVDVDEKTRLVSSVHTRD